MGACSLDGGRRLTPSRCGGILGEAVLEVTKARLYTKTRGRPKTRVRQSGARGSTDRETDGGCRRYSH